MGEYVYPVSIKLESKVAFSGTKRKLPDPVIEFTFKEAKKAKLTLNMLIPGWSKKIEVYVNDQQQVINATPGSYLSLQRVWKNNDKIRLVFHYDFYLKPMPDDENVFAIFYGPVMLAAETAAEFILKGRKDDILRNITPTGDNTFRLINGGKTFVLRPLSDINQQSYGVYATIRNY
ncbi:MAG TPA: hypothetical protein VIM72_24520 [Chitinophaga sp.]